MKNLPVKQALLLLITLCLLLTPTLAAYADIIAAPDNDFYDRHRNECVLLGRSFAVNGGNGFVSLKKAPGSGGELAVIENGEIIYLEYSCLYKGDYWGLTSFDNPDKTSRQWRLYGWVKTDQLLVLYDDVAFEEDHLADIYLYRGDYAAIKETKAAIAWPWPGAGAILWTVEGLDAASFRVAYAYRDAEGREWGMVTYLYGSRDIWVCLSDPLNRDIPAFNPEPAPTLWVSETAHTDIGISQNPTLALIIGLVALVVFGTAVLIRVFWKPKKEEGKP